MQVKTETFKDIVCPDCAKPLPYAKVVNDKIEITTGHPVRTYYGWCFECDHGVSCVQFKHNDRWFIHKYQRYDLDDNGKARPSGEWCFLVDLPKSKDALPEVPVISIGNGDYKKDISDEQLEDYLKRIFQSFSTLVKVLDEVINLKLIKRRESK